MPSQLPRYSIIGYIFHRTQQRKLKDDDAKCLLSVMRIIMHHYFVCGLAIASIKRDGMIQTGTVPSYRSTFSVPNLLNCIVVKDPIINETDGRPDGYFTCCDRYMMYGTVYHGSSLSIDAQKIPTSRLSTLNATSLPRQARLLCTT